MADNLPNSGNVNANSGATEGWVELAKDIWQQHGTKIIAAVLVLVVAIFALAQHFGTASQKQAAMTEDLGRGLEFVYLGQTDSALAAFEGSIQSGVLKDLPLAKAALLAGNIRLQNGDLDSAEILFKLSVGNSGSANLISSAAENGLAVVAMERKDYAKAISALNDFIEKYGKRDGNLANRYTKNEHADLSPTVADALWKLSLCYFEQKDTANAKKTAEKILKIYGDSPRAANARKLIAIL
ncbi:hypothetical protein AGMMS49938_12170 [Fibrobacterales bacterium]|nr:hypothetical protein AGMMS49938_12170 [Fibrobacterales bacterium]